MYDESYFLYLKEEKERRKKNHPHNIKYNTHEILSVCLFSFVSFSSVLVSFDSFTRS